MPNKLSQFWQELKKRNVVRVVIVYAGASYVILELVSIIVEPLKLPEWFLSMVIVLLCIGFVIAIILSWIYDIHPEGGMVKTGPVDKAKAEIKSKSSNGWKIASYISFVVIVGLLVFNIVTRTSRSDAKEDLDKSIAVLPFINDSEDQGNEHIINGIMEEILINLQSIKEFRVPGRTSSEQYRDKPKSIPEIASELNVAYIVEGSGQKYGNKIRLRVQLVEGATDKHIWADSYDEVIYGPEDIFRIQSQIATSIASELHAVITPKEREIIEKVPTTNLTAYDFYQRGREDYLKNWVENRDNVALDRAEKLFLKALDLDSSFANAYVGLARLYWAKQGFRTYVSENHLDSILILCDLALSYEGQLAEAYTLKGFYYMENGQSKQALEEFDKALTYNPNDWETYRWKGHLYNQNDPAKTIYNYRKAVSLNNDAELPTLLKRLGEAYANAGFVERMNFYYDEAFKLDGDSVAYYYNLAVSEQNLGNFDRSAELLVKAFEMDTSRRGILIQIGINYMYAGSYEEMLDYYSKYFTWAEASGIVNVHSMHRMGFAYAMNGFIEEADHYFDKMIAYYESLIVQGRATSGTYYDLAGVYAFRGDEDSAITNLRKFNQQEIFPRWWIELFTRDPLFDNIRDKPEFQQIARDVETKYQAEHERIRQWLEENDML